VAVAEPGEPEEDGGYVPPEPRAGHD
jgi:hypothetical protein